MPLIDPDNILFWTAQNCCINADDFVKLHRCNALQCAVWEKNMSTIVNSWNEWDPLKHVIVGRADDCHIPPEEPALDAKVP